MPGESEQVPTNFVLPSMAATRSAPIGPDGIAYQVEAIIGHADPDDPDGLFVFARWVGYESPTWEPASEIPRAMVQLYLQRNNLLQEQQSRLKSTSRDPGKGPSTRHPREHGYREGHMNSTWRAYKWNKVPCSQKTHVATTCSAYKNVHVASTWQACKYDHVAISGLLIDWATWRPRGRLAHTSTW